MSLQPHPMAPIPADTCRVAHAAFPKGNPSLTFRDALGTLFQDADFAALYARTGQPGLAPWRLALVTLMQFRENLADRQAAEAVRARIDWKYLLSLELTDPGFDFSVLSEFRDRLVAGHAEVLLLDTLLERCRALGLLTARGQQRTDSTHVLAAIRVLNRLELVAETLRAALNAVATVAPDWLQAITPLAWYERSSRRIEDTRLPKEPAARAAYAQQVGADGVQLLEALDHPEAPEAARALPRIAALRQAWQRHDERVAEAMAAPERPVSSRVRFKANRELPPAAEGIESPYDVEARYRHKRDTAWTGYMVHISETCEPTTPHLLTHVHTTPATGHEARGTAAIQQALVDTDLAPGDHRVDAASIAADLLVRSQEEQGIRLRGPTRPNQSWQAQVEGGYRIEHFTVNWERQQVRCPQGKTSVRWLESTASSRGPYMHIRFDPHDCGPCVARASCTRAPEQPRALQLPPRAQSEALDAARIWYTSAEGQHHYAQRAGIEGTLSQGVRAFGLRQTRYEGLAKTRLQHLAIAAAINMERLAAWLDGRPHAPTRTSRFAALAA